MKNVFSGKQDSKEQRQELATKRTAKYIDAIETSLHRVCRTGARKCISRGQKIYRIELQ